MKEMYFTIAGCNHYYGSDISNLVANIRQNIYHLNHT